MATTLTIIDSTGKETGNTLDIQESWLETEKGEQAVKDSVVAFLAGLRSGTACTKTKGLVSGGGAKPYRQKGTGRARQGSSRSPVHRGGGIVFGPQPRSYAKKVNSKVAKLALRRAFSDRLAENDVILVDKLGDVLDGNAPKTKKFVQFLKAVKAGDNALVLDAPVDLNVELASNNLPLVLVMSAISVNPYLMLRFKKVVITKAGLEALGERLS
ncbi:MAG: 50S ribosomal protein L4 [Victivallales bacterium]|nr:50S ribosomal protein L4 [Victivallales bacterium]